MTDSNFSTLRRGTQGSTAGYPTKFGSSMSKGVSVIREYANIAVRQAERYPDIQTDT